MVELNFHSGAFNLSRFFSKQEIYSISMSELTRGLKKSQWMGFIFPQIDGLGESSSTKYYAIKSIDENIAYFEHPKQGLCFVECCTTFLEIQADQHQKFGFPEDIK